MKDDCSSLLRETVYVRAELQLRRAVRPSDRDGSTLDWEHLDVSRLDRLLDGWMLQEIEHRDSVGLVHWELDGRATITAYVILHSVASGAVQPELGSELDSFDFELVFIHEPTGIGFLRFDPRAP